VRAHSESDLLRVCERTRRILSANEMFTYDSLKESRFLLDQESCANPLMLRNSSKRYKQDTTFLAAKRELFTNDGTILSTLIERDK